jgi:hypothetical protein
VVERAVGVSLRLLEDEVTKVPKLDNQIGFEKLDPDSEAKVYGDFASYHQGRKVIIDVTLNSRPCHATIAATEARKTREYLKNRRLDEGRFIPFAVDTCGQMGPQAVKYLKEANTERIKKCPALRYDHQYRYAIEGISLAICRANGVYSTRMREGIPDKKRDGEEEQDPVATTRRRRRRTTAGVAQPTVPEDAVAVLMSSFTSLAL